MVRLERETSNSLFEILEDWEAYLQAENLNFADLSQNSDEDVKSVLENIEERAPSCTSCSKLKRKHSAQRLVP